MTTIPDQLALPIRPILAVSEIIGPALQILGPGMTSPSATLLMLAIALQESGLAAREQGGNGPARGLWQFEKGGIRGVLTHKASSSTAAKICGEFGIPATVDDVYSSLALNDILSACFGRLLLWTDPKPIPVGGAMDAAWDYYVRNWRPGKPHKDRWTANYQKAMEVVR